MEAAICRQEEGTKRLRWFERLPDVFFVLRKSTAWWCLAHASGWNPVPPVREGPAIASRNERNGTSRMRPYVLDAKIHGRRLQRVGLVLVSLLLGIIPSCERNNILLRIPASHKSPPVLPALAVVCCMARLVLFLMVASGFLLVTHCNATGPLRMNTKWEGRSRSCLFCAASQSHNLGGACPRYVACMPGTVARVALGAVVKLLPVATAD